MHILVIANETVTSPTLLDAVKAHAHEPGDIVTVLAPVNEPRSGYVVYESTRRTSARRRLDKTLDYLRAQGVHAQGFVVETGPVQAAKDALIQLEPKVDEIVVSTHPAATSGWMRRNVVEDIRAAAGSLPVTHVEADPSLQDAGVNVLVLANQTVVSDELLDAIRARHAEGPASFLVVVPQSEGEEERAADRRLRLALTELRSEGVDAHGQVVHPDPYTAAMQVLHDERVNEIIVSTFPGEKSGWLRRDLVSRLRKDTSLPVQHVVSDVKVPA
jgi:hypothetical protein